MMAIRACTAAKWECHGGFAYFDKDERATRECDFEAVRRWQSFPAAAGMISVTGLLLGQVKKSEKPWIVFVDRQLAARMGDKREIVLLQNASDTREREIRNVLRGTTLASQNGWIGSGIHEAFKRPTDSSKWYSAFVTACKAAESAYDDISKTDTIAFHLIRPVVVLDGVLFAAELSADGELLLTETDSASFLFEYRSDAYLRPCYHLDVVTLESLPRYLDWITERLAAVAQIMMEDTP